MSYLLRDPAGPSSTAVWKHILPCIQVWSVDKRPGDTVDCAKCRKEFIVPSNGVGDLPKNYFALLTMSCRWNSCRVRLITVRLAVVVRWLRRKWPQSTVSNANRNSARHVKNITSHGEWLVDIPLSTLTEMSAKLQQRSRYIWWYVVVYQLQYYCSSLRSRIVYT